jgi:hypothetical protein
MDEVNEDSESEREPPKEFSLSLFLQSLLPYIESPWLRDWSLPGYMMEGGKRERKNPLSNTSYLHRARKSEPS